MTTRTQRCPVDATPLDQHTEDDFLKCEAIIRTDGRVTLPPPQTKVHASWYYKLPERYRG